MTRAKKFLNEQDTEIQKFNKYFNPVINSFTRPMMELKKLAKFEAKKVDRKFASDLQKMVDEIEMKIDDIDKFVETRMFDDK